MDVWGAAESVYQAGRTMRSTEWDAGLMGVWREHLKDREADLERFKREGNDREPGYETARVRDGEENDWERGSSVSISLTKDVGSVNETETESMFTLTPGTLAPMAPCQSATYNHTKNIFQPQFPPL